MSDYMNTNFPFFSSLIEDGKEYPDKDIRSIILHKIPYHPDIYLRYERVFAAMPPQQLEIVRKKLLDSVIRHPIMGWSQFTDVLNEVEGFEFLIKKGCSDVVFITEKGCPDCQGQRNGQRVVLEAKQIHNSLDESEYLLGSAEQPQARSVSTVIPQPLIRKIDFHIKKATEQLDKYKEDGDELFIYLDLHLDVGVKLNNNLWGELDALLEEKSKKLKQEKGITLLWVNRW